MVRANRLPKTLFICGTVLLTLGAITAVAQDYRYGNAPPRMASNVPPRAAAAPRAPFAPLSESHEKYLDQILAYWEHSSSKITQYRCQFQRWEYDPVFGPKDTFKTYSEGTIKYMAPDKGLFRVEKIAFYTPAASPEEKPTYTTQPEVHGEHWICDGEAVFEFDHQRKRLIERPLPADLRGKAIVDGPLPFLFGAKADSIKRRYWMRVITPKEAQGEYWLEAFPKSQQDAANFKKVEVIIDQKDFLPKAIQIFDRNLENPSRSVFMFDKREINPMINLDKLILWKKDFYKPVTPSGWEKVVEKLPDDTLPAGQAGPAADFRSEQTRQVSGQQYTR